MAPALDLVVDGEFRRWLSHEGLGVLNFVLAAGLISVHGLRWFLLWTL